MHFPPPAEPGLSTHRALHDLARDHGGRAGTGHDDHAIDPATTAPPRGGGEKGEQMDPETLYEYFLDRFKRDLLIEREQLGHLIIDNP